jgi:cytochrome c556
MRKVSIIIAVCMLAAVTLTLYAQMRELPPIMKEVGPASTSLTTGMGADRTMSREEVGKTADKLHGLFTETSAYWKSKNVTDATEWANTAATAADELSKAAKANDYEAMKTAKNNLQKQCKSCHDAHREQLPDKTFKIK